MTRRNRNVRQERARTGWILAATTLAALLLFACDAEQHHHYALPTDPGFGIMPSGRAVTQSRPVSAFTAVSLSGIGQVRIEQGGTESLFVTADEAYLPYLTSAVYGGVLELGKLPELDSVSTTGSILFQVTAPRLDEVELAGVGGIEVTGLDTTRFRVGMSGVGTVTASGRADHQEIDLAGVGDYLAGDLASRTIRVDLNGTTRAVVRASEHLEGYVARLCVLEVFGDPVIDVHGGGSVRRLGP